ncbi:MAG: hypothetical protein R3E58_12940 [Phycisphaerae bacterium]
MSDRIRRNLATVCLSPFTSIPLLAWPSWILFDELRDAELLTVMDADGCWIAFGRRNHCHAGPVNAQELRLEKGWTFTSVTNDHCKPMTDWLMELANEPPTLSGITCASRKKAKLKQAE